MAMPTEGAITIPLTFSSLWAALAFGFFGVIVWYIRGWPERKRAQTESDHSLRSDLMSKIGELEQLRLEDRKQCQLEQEELRGKIRDMQERFNGIVRQFIHYQMTVAKAIPPGADAAHLSPALEQMLDALSGVLLDAQVMNNSSIPARVIVVEQPEQPEAL